MALKDEYFTISEAAKEIKVTRQTISRWIKDGNLPTEKVGRAVLIKKDALYQHNKERLLEENRTSFEGQVISYIREQYNYTEDDEIKFIKADMPYLILSIFEKRNIPEEQKTKWVWEFLVTLKNGVQEKVFVQTGKTEHLHRNQGDPFVLFGMKKPIEKVEKEILEQENDKGVVR